MPPVVELLAVLLLLAVSIGLIEVPCENAQCAALHRTHRKDEQVERHRATAKQAHDNWHTPESPARGCEWCPRDNR